MSRRNSSSSPLQTLGAIVGTIIIIILALLGGGKVLNIGTGGDTGGIQDNSGGAAGGGNSSGASANGLPSQSFKQTAKEITYHGCPPAGDGGDSQLNLNKNRVDAGNFQPTNFNAILTLPWPKETERTSHDQWSASAASQVAQAEGLPVLVEGYLALARQEGPESPNCHSGTDFDFHIWMIDHPGGSADRVGGVVAEATPRVRITHPQWTVRNLNNLSTAGTKVRISGWLMLDPEHPDQVGKTRGTIWEIHPIIKIEYWQSGSWVNLDDYQG
ncbi:MAG TPA: hypothetical protein VMT34_02490 [Aggregatilineales bacterium]|nr:hypothetical protein [Aggregatilineales bacterium]